MVARKRPKFPRTGQPAHGLARYRSMRDFSVTAEPSGRGPAPLRPSPHKAATLPFVVQKHAATRLHYDFRLGWDGVLKSIVKV